MNKHQKIYVVIIVIVVLASVVYFILKHDENGDKEMFNEIEYTVPEGFSSESDLYFSRYHSYSDNSVYCDFNVYASEKGYYEDLKDWFNTMISVNLKDEVGKLSEIAINDNKAYHITVKSSTTRYDYYGIESSSYFYLLTYELEDMENGDRDDVGTNLCDIAKDKILKTINVK